MQMTIFIIKESEENNLEENVEDPAIMMTDEESFEKLKFSNTLGYSIKLRSDAPTYLDACNQSTITTQYESLDETSVKSFNSYQKRTTRDIDNYSRAVFHKSDNRQNQKVSSDTQWNHVGSGSYDLKWYHCDKLGNSQSDLSSSKWLYSLDGNMKSDFSHKNFTHAFNSSENDIFPSRNPNESYSRPHPFFKSSSSSQLPYIRSNIAQANRHWKNDGSRPPSIISSPQSYIPSPLSSSNLAYGRNFCFCNGNCKKLKTESVVSLEEDPETPEGLSWRRLHMSRAKLKATATTSELLSGFAMVAMVELQINNPTTVPEWLFVLFAVCTTILVSVHIFALMISTYLLPNIDAVSKLHVSSLVTESPHDKMKSFIELAWAFSTILGLFLFLVEIAILCWVKFWDYSFTAAMSATMIIIPVLVMFVAFAMHFYHSLVVIKCKNSISNMQELENMKKQLDNVSPA